MFDGRATNRYFLRAAYIDVAHNEGAMGPPTPPIYLPPVIPPRTPVITSVKGGDRSATITWTTANAEAGGRYLLYRTDDDYRLRDVRLMELAANVAPPVAGAPASEAKWIEHRLPRVHRRPWQHVRSVKTGFGFRARRKTARAADLGRASMDDPRRQFT
jgi:hypothetical protein